MRDKSEEIVSLREENLALRESNIRLQVEYYKLNKAFKKEKNRNKMFENFRNRMSRKERQDLEVVNDEDYNNFEDATDGEIFDNEYFEFIDDGAGNEYESETEIFEDGMSYNSYQEEDYFEESFEDNYGEPTDKDIPMEIPEKYPMGNQSADTTEKIERHRLQLPNKIPITKSQIKYLENLKEGKKYDGFFVCKLMDIFFDRDTLVAASNNSSKNEFKQKMSFQQLDPVKIKLMRSEFHFLVLKFPTFWNFKF